MIGLPSVKIAKNVIEYTKELRQVFLSTGIQRVKKLLRKNIKGYVSRLYLIRNRHIHVLNKNKQLFFSQKNETQT